MFKTVTFSIIACCVLSFDAHAASQDQMAPSELMGGVGLVLTKERHAYAVIRDVLEYGSARAAGIKAGDKLTAIEHEPTAGMTLDELVTRLRGPIGTIVEVTVLSDDDSISFHLQRANLMPPQNPFLGSGGWLTYRARETTIDSSIRKVRALATQYCASAGATEFIKRIGIGEKDEVCAEFRCLSED